MILITAFHRVDADSAVRLYDWIRELGSHKYNTVFVTDPDVPTHVVNRVLLAGRRAMGNAFVIKTDGKHKREWPFGPNAAFITAAQYAAKVKQSFLWLEPDCVPTRKTWLQEIEHEYSKCGKRYMGGIVDCNPPLPRKVMYGVAVYHPSAIEIVSKRVQPNMGVAFDVSMSEDTVPLSFASKLFQFASPNKSDATQISRGVALFHSDKTGNHIGRMRKLFSLQARQPNEQLEPRNDDPSSDDPCFVQLGRAGDILNILPVVRYHHGLCSHRRIRVVTHIDYVNVLGRCSYVDVVKHDGDINDLVGAVNLAKSLSPRVLVPQLFSSFGIQSPETPNYNTDQYKRCDALELFDRLSCEIDNRNWDAERLLYSNACKTPNGIVAYNLTGVSSPFGGEDQLSKELKWRYGDSAVDLNFHRSKFHTDQLGILDKCAVLLTVDTFTAHLAQASHCPYIFLASNHEGNPWKASKLRRKPIAQMTCDDYDTAEIFKIIDSKLYSKQNRGRVWHCVQIRDTKDQRVLRARESWEKMYSVGTVKPIHIPDSFNRTAEIIGDKRKLPFLRDILKIAADNISDSDILIFTNDDVAFGARSVEQSVLKLNHVPIVTGARSDVDNVSSPTDFRRHLGRDFVAFRGDWLRKNINLIPDFIVGASEWDLVVAAMARKHCGIEMICDNIGVVFPECEIPFKLITHEPHDAVWQRAENVNTSPSQKHNRALAEEWFRSNSRSLKLHWFSRL